MGSASPTGSSVGQLESELVSGTTSHAEVGTSGTGLGDGTVLTNHEGNTSLPGPINESVCHEPIHPEPLVEHESDVDEQETIIHLPDLQMTQCFIDALRVASLNDSGMCHEDIINLRNPGPVQDLKDLLPLL